MVGIRVEKRERESTVFPTLSLNLGLGPVFYFYILLSKIRNAPTAPANLELIILGDKLHVEGPGYLQRSADGNRDGVNLLHRLGVEILRWRD